MGQFGTTYITTTIKLGLETEQVDNEVSDHVIVDFILVLIHKVLITLRSGEE